MLSFKFLIVIFFYYTKYFNTHTWGEGRWENVLKKPTVVYIQKGLKW